MKQPKLTKDRLMLIGVAIGLTLIQILLAIYFSSSIQEYNIHFPLALESANVLAGSLSNLAGIGNIPHFGTTIRFAIGLAISLLLLAIADKYPKWRHFVPTAIFPGSISNNLEGLFFGKVTNWIIIPTGGVSTKALSPGDIALVGGLMIFYFTLFVHTRLAIMASRKKITIDRK